MSLSLNELTDWGRVMHIYVHKIKQQTILRTANFMESKKRISLSAFCYRK